MISLFKNLELDNNATAFNEMKDWLYDLMEKYGVELEYLNGLFAYYDMVTGNNVETDTEEAVLALDRAWRAICTYEWWDYETKDPAPYRNIILSLAKTYYQNERINNCAIAGQAQVTQKTQGSRSITFRNSAVELDSDGMTAEIKRALPPRKLRVL